MESPQKVTDSEKAYQILRKDWNKNTIELNEEFKVMLLNNSNEVLGIWIMSKGGMTGVTVDLKLLFSVVLKSCATAIITAHNHPSGKLLPSLADEKMYDKIKKGCSFLGINYLDNLIVTKEGKYSFADEYK